MKCNPARLAIALLITLIAVPAAAQTCAGFTPVTRQNPGNAGANLTFTSSTTAFGGSVTGGSDSVLVNGTFGRVHEDDFDVTGTMFGVLVAGQVPIDAKKKAWLCPGFGVSRLWSNDILGSGLNAAQLTFVGGVSVGAVASSSATFDLVPTVTVQFGRARLTATGVPSESDTLGLFTAGVGLVMNKRFTVQPSISRPFGVDGAETSFSIVAAFGFGSK